MKKIAMWLKSTCFLLFLFYYFVSADNQVGSDKISSLDENNDDGHFHWNDKYNRKSPDRPESHATKDSYVIAPEKLNEIRGELLYWFFDRGGPEDFGDFLREIHNSNRVVHRNLRFPLNSFGFQFDYTRIHLDGFIGFSDLPETLTYPLMFPSRRWPQENDPAFIGIFFSRCRVGRIFQTDIDQRMPGVYLRTEMDLQNRDDPFGVELRERVKWDIREGIVGAETFDPQNVIIVTWKNMSFAGGIDNSLYITNTFQMVLVSDDVSAYVIFNYAAINWLSHAEAGGDTSTGNGGIPAFVGFNAGNGTRSFEYKPYSQSSLLPNIVTEGWGNGIPGRHIFRIDENIWRGSCETQELGGFDELVVSPESGNMLGGTIVNFTGPCLRPSDEIVCRFGSTEVLGHYVDVNRGFCIQPPLLDQDSIRLDVRVGSGSFSWRGRYSVDRPSAATEGVMFYAVDEVHQIEPEQIRIFWNQGNLTRNFNDRVKISLLGYRGGSDLVYIDELEYSIANIGVYTIVPANYRMRNNRDVADAEFGFIRIMLADSDVVSSTLWSRPIPLAWYFKFQWERMHGYEWPQKFCQNWTKADEATGEFISKLPDCPCTLEQALLNKGQFMADPQCDRVANPNCVHHQGAQHCLRSGQPMLNGAEQQCCYDFEGSLMLSQEKSASGSFPKKSHDAVSERFLEEGIPTLSQWLNDIRGLYSCCRWQDDEAESCQMFRTKTRRSSDCTSYKSPAVASIFGDPHVITFDGLQYTFNGFGEFVLLRSIIENHSIEVQGRFQQVERNQHGPVMATQLTSIAVMFDNVTVIEVRMRPTAAQWRYRLDVLANSRRIYFDRDNIRSHIFNAATIYTPSDVTNQSQIIMMHQSGAGIEVAENSGFLNARVYLPRSFVNKTRGLFGNWSFDVSDDLVHPDGRLVLPNLNNFEAVHRDFAMAWMLSDRSVVGVGTAVFTRENGRTSSFYTDPAFLPNFIREPRDFLFPNRTQDIERATELCGESYQCRYDYGMSLNEEMALLTRKAYEEDLSIRRSFWNNENLKKMLQKN